jgi:hypothetical protein
MEIKKYQVLQIGLFKQYKTAPVRTVSLRLVFDKSAPARLAPVRLLFDKSAPDKFAPLRSPP